MAENIEDLYLYAEDLIEIGVIKSQEEFLKFFNSNANSGQEVQIAQQLVHDHCLGSVDKPNNNLSNQDCRNIEVLLRLYPQYEYDHLCNLYRTLYDNNVENKLGVILNIMSVHSDILNKLPSEQNEPKDEVREDCNEIMVQNEAEDNKNPMDCDALDIDELTNDKMIDYKLLDDELNDVRKHDKMLHDMIINNKITHKNQDQIPLNSIVDKYDPYGPSTSFYGTSIKCVPTSTIVKPEVVVPEEVSVPSSSTDSTVMVPFVEAKTPSVNIPTVNAPIGNVPVVNTPVVKWSSGESTIRVTCRPVEQLYPPKRNFENNCGWVGFGASNTQPLNYSIGNPVRDTATAPYIAPVHTRSHLIYTHRPITPPIVPNIPNIIVPPQQPNFNAIDVMPRSSGVVPKTRKAPEDKTRLLKKMRRSPDEDSDSDNDVYRRGARDCEPDCPCRKRRPAVIKKKHRHPNDVVFVNEQSESTDDSLPSIILPELVVEKPKKSAKAGTSYCQKLCSHLMEMFPDACPAYIKGLCAGRKMSEQAVEELLQIIFASPDYPKRAQKSPTPPLELDLESQTNLLKDLFPDADPTYLESQAEVYLEDPEGFQEFITESLEQRDYPTKKDYLRRQQINAQVKQYTSEFNVDNFLEIIPDPEAYFNDLSRRTITSNSIERHLCFQVIKNLYPLVPVRHMSSAQYADNLMKTAMIFDSNSHMKFLKTKRKAVPVDLSALQNVPLLQEIAYLTHRDVILKRVEEKKLQAAKEREEAKAQGLMMTCNCCYDDEVMLKDCRTCDKGCNFCVNCVKTSVQIAFNEGKSDFSCLVDCQGTFTLTTLRDSLPPKLFSKVAQRKQLQEVKAAGIDDVVTCPFCDFATIPPPGDKIFKCLNPDCMKESCLMCKEPSHVPLRCDEIEKDDDVKKRTYIENKMTEALVRVCYKCGMKFIKEDGCNKMTCSCGAKMCYVCLQPVTDYKHFNGQGGDKYHLCPLYSDTNTMHENQVLRGAETAKQELGIANNEELKVDPMADVHQHYSSRRRAQPTLPGVEPDNLQMFFNMIERDLPRRIEARLQERHRVNIRGHRGPHRQ